MRKLTWLSFLTAWFLSANIANAAVGTITVQEQAPAQITHKDQKLPGTQGAGVEMADVVETVNGKANIKFIDNTLVEVNDHSRLEIDEFVFDPNTPAAGKLAMNFASGTLRYASGAIAHNDPTKVALNTPAATIAVRGTDFATTIDETGATLVILLPSCPERWQDIDRDCKTGVIEVYNSAGRVILDRPFQATKVANRYDAPLAPVRISLTMGAINNLLIVSPPDAIMRAMAASSRTDHHGLDLNLDSTDDNTLANVFGLVKQYTANKNSQITVGMVASTTTSAAPTNPYAKIFPDYNPATGVKPVVTNTEAGLCRPDGASNIQCVYIPLNQNTTITQTQGNVTVINKAYSGGNTIITLKQN